MKPDFGRCRILLSKHFKNDHAKEWNWDYQDIRNALIEAYKVDKVGKEKYEVYTNYEGFKKIVLVYREKSCELFVITGAEASKKHE